VVFRSLCSLLFDIVLSRNKEMASKAMPRSLTRARVSLRPRPKVRGEFTTVRLESEGLVAW